MNRIFSLFLLVAGFVMAAEVTTISGFDASVKPADLTAVTICDDDATDSQDTLAAAEVLYIGPINLTTDRNSPMFKGFQYYLGIATGTTPVAAFDYTLLSGSSLSDTTGSWTLADTLTTSEQTGYVDLTDEAGNYIVFRINNYDATETQLPNESKVYFKRNENYDNERRR